ncbi:hypothetical protein L2E82_25142 [Cichorium intybus]|uniref:Uncharacterized protein n=1 Tax=Cichorium intybus TaxID=13427 RepID=A0ACB9E2U1_CICIN|nr:hypothetical protein L2E82_25142 [Cichorium intybus]
MQRLQEEWYDMNISLAQGIETLTDFAEHLAASVDIVFHVIHGRFGKEGDIQELLEKSNVQFVGTRSKECRTAFDKGNELGESVAYGVADFLTKVREIISEIPLAALGEMFEGARNIMNLLGD